MNGILARYLRRRVLGLAVGMLLVLTGLMQVLELLDVTDDIIDRGLGAAGVLHYLSLRTPAQIMLALPMAALVGPMAAFYFMARSGEVIAIRCAGVSLARLVTWLLPVPLLLAALQFGLSQTVVPRTEYALKNWWEATKPANPAANRRWVRTRSGPVSFERASPDGRELGAVRIYLRDADGLLTGRISARTARWSDGAWRLGEVVRLSVSGGKLQRSTVVAEPWMTNLRPEDILRLDVSRPFLSSVTLVDVIAGERVGVQPRSYYRTVLYRSLTAPLAVFVMLLLAVPPASGLFRAGGGGGRLLVALGLGLAFLLTDGMLSALGTGGQLSPAAAALTAPLLFAILGIAQLEFWERR